MVCVIFTLSALNGQFNDPVKDNAIDKLIEFHSRQGSEDTDYSSLIEFLESAYEQPVNLNTAARAQLERLMVLSDLQIDQLLLYRERNGELLSIYELQLVYGWDEQTVFMILPFVQVAKDTKAGRWKWKNVFKFGKHELVGRFSSLLEQQKGFAPPDSGVARYLGSPYQLFFRYKFTFRDKVIAGITSKKDRGEEFFKGSQPFGFDYNSAHVFFRDWGPFESLALGDYQLQFGQGLTLWKGFGSGKSMYVGNLRRFAQGVRPYSAASPFMFFRGAAFTVKAGPVRSSAFASYKRLDATFTSDSTNEVSSLYETGYHRTQTELDKMNRLGEFVTGGNISFRAMQWAIGITGTYTRYSSALNPGSEPYRLFAFRGDQAFSLGLDYNLLLGKFYLFGEVAFCHTGGHAILQGVQAYLHPQFSVAILFRDYARNHVNPHGQAFGELSSNQNEQGFYLAFEGSPIRKFRFSGYFDVFRFPWLRFNVDRPSWGFETSSQITFSPSRRTEIYLRCMHSLSQQNSRSNDDYTEPIADIRKTSLRLNYLHEVGPDFKLRGRLEAVILERPDDNFRWGFVAYQDVIYRFPWFPLDMSCRIAVFRTDDYDSRIFAYESDVHYSFSVPAYYQSGMRFYLNLKYQITKGLSVWFKVAQTYFAHANQIGSGLDEIQGNTRTEIKCQIRYRFGIYRKSKVQRPASKLII